MDLKLVVGIDGSGESREAMRWASRLCGRVGGEIVIVHALGPPVIGADVVAGQLHRSSMEQVLEAEWCAPARRDGTSVRGLVCEGPPVDVLLDVAEAAGADLIVVGNRGGGRAPDLGLGSTSLHVLRAASAPVLVVPERESSARHLGLRRVLAATDGTDTSLAAVEVACEVAEAFGAWVTAVQAVEDHAQAFTSNSALHRRIHRYNGAPAHVSVRRGRPDDVVRALASVIDADLVVTGCRPHREGEGLVAGSVSRQVVRAVHRPTLVVPEGCAASGWSGRRRRSPVGPEPGRLSA